LKAYVPGTDYRVHVMGEEVFACAIRSPADDYRYASRHNVAVEIRSCDLPIDCIDRCRAMAKAMRLSVAGIDLRQTPDGCWFCFEVNPSPAFTFYQERTGQKIAEALARCLAAARQC